MLSSDKNVESIAQLIEVLKKHIGLQKEYLKFDVIDKTVRLLTAFTLFTIFFVLLIAMMFYLSFAIVYWMAPATGLGGAFAIVSGAFTIMLIAIFAYRKSLIERPLVRFLANLLLN